MSFLLVALLTSHCLHPWIQSPAISVHYQELVLFCQICQNAVAMLIAKTQITDWVNNMRHVLYRQRRLALLLFGWTTGRRNAFKKYKANCRTSWFPWQQASHAYILVPAWVPSQTPTHSTLHCVHLFGINSFISLSFLCEDSSCIYSDGKQVFITLLFLVFNIFPVHTFIHFKRHIF